MRNVEGRCQSCLAEVRNRKGTEGGLRAGAGWTWHSEFPPVPTLVQVATQLKVSPPLTEKLFPTAAIEIYCYINTFLIYLSNVSKFRWIANKNLDTLISWVLGPGDLSAGCNPAQGFSSLRSQRNFFQQLLYERYNLHTHKHAKTQRHKDTSTQRPTFKP